MGLPVIKFPGHGNFYGGELQDVRFESKLTSPQDAAEARFWYDSVNHRPMYNNGTSNVEFGRTYTFSTGLINSNDTITVDTSVIQATNTAVTHTASTAAGSATQPVYVNSSGVATACTYTLGKSVPSDAVFTDTTYTNGTGLTLTGTTFAIDTSTVALKSDITAVYKAAGTVASASDLPTLSASVLGNVYNVTTSFTTTSDFVEGSGKTIQVGNDIAVVDVGSGSTHTYKFSVMGDFVDLSSYQKSNTAVTHTASTAVGSATKGVYIASDGTATAMTYSVSKDVPSDAVFTDTTYANGTGITIGTGNAINHSNSITAGTAGTSSATSGSTLAVPYITYDAQGHITGKGTHTHTVTGFLTSIDGMKVTQALNYTPAQLTCEFNPALTSLSNGVCEWTFTRPTRPSTVPVQVDYNMQISVYEVETNGNTTTYNIVYPSVSITGTTVTVSLLSSSNISANKYMACICY